MTNDRQCPICGGDWRGETFPDRVVVHAASCPWSKWQGGKSAPSWRADSGMIVLGFPDVGDPVTPSEHQTGPVSDVPAGQKGGGGGI